MKNSILMSLFLIYYYLYFSLSNLSSSPNKIHPSNPYLSIKTLNPVLDIDITIASSSLSLSLKNKYVLKSEDALEAYLAILFFKFNLSHYLVIKSLFDIFAGSPSTSQAADNSLCTKTSAYLLMGEVK